jgi:hypothetical protein
MTILTIFEIDVLSLINVYRSRFLLHPLFILDLIFTTGGLVMEGILRNVLASLTVIYRLWRLIRISKTKLQLLICESLFGFGNSTKKRRNENFKMEKKEEISSSNN